MEWFILSLILVFHLITAWIMPWINHGRIQKITKENTNLKIRLTAIRNYLERAGISTDISTDIQDRAPQIPPQTSQQTEPAPQTTPGEIEKQPSPPVPPAIVPDVAAREPITTPPTATKHSLEQQFGARWMVWVGAVALALSGFFLVKYSIDKDLISPTIRVILGAILGAILLLSGAAIRRYPHIANGKPIAQALSGAGICVFYGVFYAAANLYQLIPNWSGFLALSAVTALAVVLSLRHGPPIAILALVGGFATPALIQTSNPSAVTLFIYLYLVFTGLLIVIRHKDWWGIAIPALLGVFIWLGIWFSTNFYSEDILYLAIFLLGICSTILFAIQPYEAEITSDSLLNIPATANRRSMYLFYCLGLGGTICFMAAIVNKVEFDAFAWALFGLLALGSVIIAAMKERLYGLAPLWALLLTSILLIAWQPETPADYMMIVLPFGAFYFVSGYVLLWFARWPLSWAMLVVGAGLGFYLIAYFKLGHSQPWPQIALFWELIALGFAAFFVYGAYETRRRFGGHSQEQILLAIFSTLAVSFLAIVLILALDLAILPLGLAIEIFALCWINSRIPIKALPILAAILAVAFAGFLAPRLLESEIMDTIDKPLVQLAIPGFLFVAASYYLRYEKDSEIVKIFEWAAAGLCTACGYYLIRHFFAAGNIDSSFLEYGVIANFLFLSGLIALLGGRQYHRTAYIQFGAILYCLASLFIILFAFLLHNPLFSPQRIDGWPILNSLLLSYGSPMLWICLTTRQMRQIPAMRAQLPLWEQCQYMLLLLFSFSWVSLQLRHFFHGAYLNAPSFVQGEIYAYSAAWLFFGILLLVLGTIKKDKTLRYVSLFMVTFTIIKVFLYDTSALEGLYRVFAFLLLGICLLGISWFYARFIFKQPGRQIP